MTDKEALAIKGMVEEAFPFAKQSKMGDAIYISVLVDYQFMGIKKSLDKLIQSGKKYTPTLGEIIQGYEVILSPQQEYIFNLMDDAGEFMDEMGDAEVRMWNYNNRKVKSRMWIANDTMPTWFRTRYERYSTAQLNSAQGQIEGVM